MPSPDTNVRRATSADVERIAAIHVASWRRAYRGQLPDALIESMSIAQRAQRWHELLASPAHDLHVAVRDGAILGFCSLIPSRDVDAPESTGEIAALYVDPAHWRAGIGRGLVLGAIEQAQHRAYRQLTLWVLASNASARAFYASLGFAADGAEKTEQRQGHEMYEVRYRRALDSD